MSTTTTSRPLHHHRKSVTKSFLCFSCDLNHSIDRVQGSRFEGDLMNTRTNHVTQNIHRSIMRGYTSSDRDTEYRKTLFTQFQRQRKLKSPLLGVEIQQIDVETNTGIQLGAKHLDTLSEDVSSGKSTSRELSPISRICCSCHKIHTVQRRGGCHSRNHDTRHLETSCPFCFHSSLRIKSRFEILFPRCCKSYLIRA